MKVKMLICSGALALIILSCGGNKSEPTETKSEPAPTAQDEAIKEGEQLVAQNDCKTCHHPTNKIIGPAHTDVAKKYEFTAANVDTLAAHIIKGSIGTWGQIPMNAHADLSLDDARKMARYVLSLDGEKEN